MHFADTNAKLNDWCWVLASKQTQEHGSFLSGHDNLSQNEAANASNDAYHVMYVFTLTKPFHYLFGILSISLCNSSDLSLLMA